MTAGAPPPPLARLLIGLAGIVERRSAIVVAAGLALALLAGLFASQRLVMATARIDLIGQDVPYVRKLLDLEEEFGDLNSIVAVVRGEDERAARAVADALAARVREDTARFRGVFHRFDPTRLGAQALLFADAEQLAQLDAMAQRLLPGLAGGALPGAIDGFAGELEARLAAGGAGGGGGDAALVGIADALLRDLGAALAGEDPTGTPLDELAGWDDVGYVRGGDGSFILLIAFREADTGELDPKSAAVAAARAAAGELERAHPGVEVGFTGKPVLDVDEMRTYEVDSTKTSLVALISVTLLLVVAFRRLLAPLLVGGCLLLAVIDTLGFAALWPGHLNLMAVVFVVVVIGLGVDFGVHLVARYDELSAAGRPPREALSETLRRTGPAIVTGAATTAAAFLCAVLTDFKGLREFGVIAAAGVIASLGVMLTVLPALVLLVDRRRGKPAPPGPGITLRALGGVDRLTRGHPRKVLAVAAGVTLLAAAFAPRVRYDGNLLALQDPTLDSVQLELRLLRDEQLSSWFLAYTTADLAELEAAAARARAIPGVERVESVLDRLPAGQDERLEAVHALQERARGLAPAAEWGDERLRAALARLQEALETALDEALTGGREEALATLERLLERTEAALQAAADGVHPAARRYDRALAAAIERRLAPLSGPPTELLTPANLPPELKDRLIGRSGRYLLRIYPEEDLWEPAPRGRFLAAVQAVLPEVTGIPLLVHESSRSMAHGYLQAGLYSLGLVAVCVLLHFRRLGPSLLSLGTLGLGGLWLAGLLGACGLPLNPANLIALPLLLGIGIDTSVHVIHRAQEVGPHEPLIGTSLGSAVSFSGLTSVASFGSLAIASHPGSASIGIVVSLGILCCLVAGLTVPAAALACLAHGRSPRHG